MRERAAPGEERRMQPLVRAEDEGERETRERGGGNYDKEYRSKSTRRERGIKEALE